MLTQEAEDNRERHHRQVVGRQLLVAGGHAAEPLQAVDAALDDIAPPVRLPLEPAPPGLLVLLVGDDRLDPTLRQPLPQPAGRVPLVPGHLRRLLRPGRRLLQQRDGLLRLMLLPRPDGHGDRRARPVTDQVQLRAEAALAAAQGVVGRLAGWRFFSRPRRLTDGRGPRCHRCRTGTNRWRRGASYGPGGGAGSCPTGPAGPSCGSGRRRTARGRTRPGRCASGRRRTAPRGCRRSSGGDPSTGRRGGRSWARDPGSAATAGPRVGRSVKSRGWGRSWSVTRAPGLEGSTTPFDSPDTP